MSFDRTERCAILRDNAPAYVDMGLVNIVREYPNMPFYVAVSPASNRTHREMHPAFYGCLDWHSCVELHWVIVRMLRLFPDVFDGAPAREALNGLLTAENIAAEVDFYSEPQNRGIERPYGWGWLLTLYHELAIWGDPDGKVWAANLKPLADLLSGYIVDWLPRMSYPQRTGVHPNTAFALSRTLDHAERLAGAGDDALLNAIRSVGPRWFSNDLDYPAHYEPAGADFLSAGLCEAEFMSRILPSDQFPGWLERFLPSLASSRPDNLFQPAVVIDETDGQFAHLHGLNLSRAWAFTALAEKLPAGDPRIEPMMTAAKVHADKALPEVVGSNYMVEHWLAVYATLLLS